MGSAPSCCFSQDTGLSARVAEDLQILHLVSNLGESVVTLRSVSACLSASAGERDRNCICVSVATFGSDLVLRIIKIVKDL